MIILYHILTSILLIAALPFLPLVWLASEKRRANLLQRLGLFTGIPGPESGERRIWVHALSVGEVNSAIPFVRHLKKANPGLNIVMTASTWTGYDTARRHLKPGSAGSPVDALGYFPFDVWICVMAVWSKIRPDLVCLVETDLWPGFLSMMKRKDIPVVLINARLSPRSLNGYRRLGRFSALFFSGLSHIMAQTGDDAEGFRQLGVSDQRISVSGNMKFDQPVPSITPETQRDLKRKFGIRPGQQAWIAGSTHDGEETMVAEAFLRLRQSRPDLKLIVAPRDPGRSRALVDSLSVSGCTPACLSDPDADRQNADIVFIDSLGELATAYAVCDLAFIGGSLVEQGGHNPLEPAMFGTPVMFGPHMTDFREVESLLLAAGGAVSVTDSDSMGETVSSLLKEDGRRRAAGDAAQKVFQDNAGAMERIIEELEERYL